MKKSPLCPLRGIRGWPPTPITYIASWSAVIRTVSIHTPGTNIECSAVCPLPLRTDKKPGAEIYLSFFLIFTARDCVVIVTSNVN